MLIPLRLDLTELELPDTMKTHFPDPADLLNFELTITPDEGTFPVISQRPPINSSRSGMYKNATFPFTVAISPNYPHQAPKVRCTKKVRISQQTPCDSPHDEACACLY